MAMIILVIKSYFFSKIDSYNLGQKPHTYYFFLHFCKEMIKVICSILTVIIKDLELCLSNSNLPMRKSAIWFKFLAQKEETSKQWLVYYITNIKNLFHKSVYLFWKNLGQNSFSMSKSDCYNSQKISYQPGSWRGTIKLWQFPIDIRTL